MDAEDSAVVAARLRRRENRPAHGGNDPGEDHCGEEQLVNLILKPPSEA